MTVRALVVLLAVLAEVPASAQTPQASPARAPKRGGGLWLDAGFGYGHVRLTCVTCPKVVAATGAAVTVTAGFTPARNVLLGLQAQQWSSTGGSVSRHVSSLLAVVQWYPWPATGFFVRGGNGIVRGPGAQASSTQGTGVGLALGLGYDVKVNRRLGLTVEAATNISAFGDLIVDGQPADDVIGYVSRLGVAVVLR